MMKNWKIRLLFVTTLSCLASCQHMTGELPYTVSDDCRVHVAEATPELGSGFSIGFGGFSPFGSDRPIRQNTPATPNVRYPSIPKERSEGGVDVGINIPIPFPTAQPDLAQHLADSGPGFPAQFSMSCVPIKGFVRGGWPVVMDYHPSGGGNVVVEIYRPGTVEPYSIELDASARRQLVKIDLPDSLGDSPQPALFLVKSTGRGTETASGLVLFGIGAGPKAVGSVAIDQVDFGPGTLHVSQKETAFYSFYSRSDFNRSVVEILRFERHADEIKVALARSTEISTGINRRTWIGKNEPRTWDGRNEENEISTGPHLLQIRAWLSAQNERDWVVAWSPNRVDVSE